MSADMETTKDATEHHPILPEAWQQVFALIELAADPKGFKRRLHGLANALAAASAAQLKLAADRAAHDTQLAKDRAELEADRAVVQKRRLDVEVAEGRSAEREQRYFELQKQWGNLKLPGDTFAAFGGLTRAPLHTPLEVARFTTEHGRLPAVDEPITVREGTDGAPFPDHTTITRSQPAPEPPAAGAAPVSA